LRESCIIAAVIPIVAGIFYPPQNPRVQASIVHCEGETNTLADVSEETLSHVLDLPISLFAPRKDTAHIHEAPGGSEHENNPITPHSPPESTLKFPAFDWDYVAAQGIFGHFLKGPMQLPAPVCGQPPELFFRILGEIHDPVHVLTDPMSCTGRA